MQIANWAACKPAKLQVHNASLVRDRDTLRMNGEEFDGLQNGPWFNFQCHGSLLNWQFDTGQLFSHKYMMRLLDRAPETLRSDSSQIEQPWALSSGKRGD